MGFNTVYRVLQEVFHQIDSRILRAVAIEHSKDVDVAVEVVLSEVVPFLPECSHAISSSYKGKSLPSPSEAVDGGKTGQLEVIMDPLDVIQCPSAQSTEADPFSINESLGASEDASFGQPNSPTVVDTVTLASLCVSSVHDANAEIDTVCDDVPLVMENAGERSCINSDIASPALICESGSSGSYDQESVKSGGEVVASLGEYVVNHAVVSSSAQEVAVVQVDIDTELEIAQSSSELASIVETHFGVTEELDVSSSLETLPEKGAIAVDIVNTEDESIMTSTLSRSDQICSTELLDGVIEDARNNKKTLVLAMDSVVNLMREVECKEKAVEQAKAEAAQRCPDIYAKVDELTQALGRAKEANEMHAGEVNAEKAILATEMKELQLRLLNLSDERNRSLEILDEMRGALEARLAIALKEIEAAKEEKLEKEKCAREALAYQESQMEIVVEESRKLKLIAEENSELQEFIMDRGRAIDALQGEISVKCQDVMLLKEKFDKRIPLSQSLSSSHTSSVLSTSSSRSPVTPFEPESEAFRTPEMSAELDDSYGFLDTSVRSVIGQTLESSTQTVYSVDRYFPSGDEKKNDNQKVLSDDDWELFDRNLCFEA